MGSMREIAIALDIGGTKTIIGLVDQTGKVIYQQRFLTNVQQSLETHLHICLQKVEDALEHTGIEKGQLAGIGVTVPGLADPDQGLLLHAPFAGWRQVPVRRVIQRSWPTLSIEIANDVNACALAESMYGKGKEWEHFLWVTISTGIGGGVIINGKMYEGSQLIAGEIGHVIVEWENGLLCGCGHRGCLEAHASGTAIAKQARDYISRSGPDSDLALYLKQHGYEPTTEKLAVAAQDGISSAQAFFYQAGTYIGRAFSYAANLLNPAAIIVGGGVSLSYALLEEGIRDSYPLAVIGESNQSLPILTTGLGYEAGLIGAASLVFSKL